MPRKTSVGYPNSLKNKRKWIGETKMQTVNLKQSCKKLNGAAQVIFDYMLFLLQQTYSIKVKPS